MRAMLVPVTIYCTIFDIGYIARALALHASLLRANTGSRLAFFCVDDDSAALLESLKLERAIIVRHEEFTTPDLERVRPSRSQGEYCWTCKPIALGYLARTRPEADWLIYVDADMMFFADPDSALPGSDMHYLLTPHHYHPAFMQFSELAGRHNAGYLAVRRSKSGQQVIDWWTERCIESCSTVLTEHTYADQKYLDRLADLFPFGVASSHPGLNAAPWNIERYRVDAEGGVVGLDGLPLLLYHFQGLRLLGRKLVDLYPGNRRLPAAVRRLIYRPYLDELQSAYRTLGRIRPGFALGVGAAPGSARDWLRLGVRMVRGYHNPVRYRFPE